MIKSSVMKRKSVVQKFLFGILFIVISGSTYAQNYWADNDNIPEFYKLKMLDCLIEKGLYSSLGEEYVYENYNTKSILLIKEIDTKTFGIKAFRFRTSEVHAPDFFMLGVDEKEALILGIGEFIENLTKVIEFTQTHIKKEETQILFIDAIFEDFMFLFKDRLDTPLHYRHKIILPDK